MCFFVRGVEALAPMNAYNSSYLSSFLVFTDLRFHFRWCFWFDDLFRKGMRVSSFGISRAASATCNFIESAVSDVTASSDTVSCTLEAAVALAVAMLSTPLAQY